MIAIIRTFLVKLSYVLDIFNNYFWRAKCYLIRQCGYIEAAIKEQTVNQDI